MGRSIGRPAPPPGSFYHRRSNRSYTISDSKMRRHQTGSSGEQINVVEKPIDLAIGSGNHAVTFVSRTPQGRLLELPLSWYTRSAQWGMSPGYDRADHDDFRREISDSCLFCHSSGANPAPIDCGRCHGQVDKHLKSPGKGSILNPAKLSSERQLEVCLQCHLQTTSRGIQDSLRRPGRDVWSYQPGTALANYKMFFDRADSEASDRIEINHAGYRLLQSACFRQSEGKLICTSCHDPHTAQVRTTGCTQCHASTHAGEGISAADGCHTCHMPKRVPADAILTVITDHKIVRKPRFTDPIAEDHTPYSGRVIPYFSEADKLSHAAAGAQRGGGDVSLYRRLVAREPENVPLLTTLGKILLRSQAPDQAVDVFEKALRLDPLHTDARNHLGVAYGVLGRLHDAAGQLRRAVADNPDHALSWTNLGVTLEALADSKAAREAYSEAIRLQPDSSEARRRRAQLDQK
jgi:tetratricopeptide (TPR) repeat protein